MSLPTIQTALNSGEWSPALFGRTDLEKYTRACSTSRNMFSSYRGGALSRPGTAFCGITRQGNKGRATQVSPPRDITFQYSTNQGITIEAGDYYFRFLSNGAYITEDPTAISGATQANPITITDVGHSYSAGDEVYIAGAGGMKQINNQSYELADVTSNSYVLVNVLDGIQVDSTNYLPYTSGGQAQRIYTLATPYAAVDLPYLKWAQSADVMTLTCVNTATGTSYPQYDLARILVNEWSLTKTQFGAAIAAPAAVSMTETDSGISTKSFYYQFVATAVDAKTGEESPPSPVGGILAVDISAEAATITINCATVTGAGSYNFYTAPESFLGYPPDLNIAPGEGAFFGYLGSAFGPSFRQTNITPDYATAPPIHNNPFATSSLFGVVMTAYGSGYHATSTTATITSPIGEDPVVQPIVIGGQIVWVAVISGGAGLSGGTPIVFTDPVGGSGATATLEIGPATGTYPSCVAYFQQRRIYAATLNQPETYFASKPGAFTNFDVSNPVIDTDAIIGTPWSQQVNGIQWMLNMPGGLVIFTGLGAWQLSGGGGGLATSAALTPSNQVANPQAYNGCSPLLPPIPINYDILYVQEKGSIVRDLSYNFFVNIYTGTDMTVLSNHLFDGYTAIQWAWSEEPNKLIWLVRNDGILLCLTYLKEQDVYAWTRHDTNGLYKSVCSVSEPPVNAPYFIVQRLIQNDGNPVWVYMQERMDNRLWLNQESSWCVDAGLSYLPSYPNAMLSVSSAAGVPTLSQPDLIYGGSNYSPTTYGEIIDPTGSGATISLTIVGGVITAASAGGTLTGYTAPQLVVIDPTGAGGGAAIDIFVIRVATVYASVGVFGNSAGAGEAGDVIRMNGRTMVVTNFVSSTQLTVNVIRNDAPTIPDDPLNTPIPVAAGGWNISAPTSVVYGLGHLEGMTVSILADGVVVQPQVVSAGSITLPQPASQVLVGLGYTCQVQTMYWNMAAGGGTVQGRRKEIDSVIARVYATGLPFDVGVNQPDASTQPGQITVPWIGMTPVQGAPAISTPLQPNDLVTADIFSDVIDQAGLTGAQVAVQQTAPIPLNLLALMPWVRLQDDVDAA